ncbi:MAG: formate dehydrogenase accessory sulfurtransferase FdhD [Gammaproteobacteria bacterium]|nr:formate dehydrogenase accessory sulfurtransferase FdhD [Gammaproteobacteria bacterium]
MSTIPSESSSAPSSIRISLDREANGVTNTVQDLVIVEEPMELQIAQGERLTQTISVTMRTPGQDFELALGYLQSEGVIQSATDVKDVRFCGPPSPDKGYQNVVQVELASDIEFDLERLQRNFYTTSSCGVCGKTSIEAIDAPLSGVVDSTFTISRDKLRDLPDRLQTWQTEFQRTGGLHAAATVEENGEIHRVREDVGRHNAVDKLIGSYLYEPGQPLRNLGLLLSGRAGFELVQKAAMAYMPFIASIGPPSNLAIELADERHITLVGFLRETGYNVYSSHGALI